MQTMFNSNHYENEEKLSEICDDSEIILNSQFDDRVNDFEELNNDTKYFSEPNIDPSDMRFLHPNTHCTVFDAISMIYAYSIRHNLTWVATEDLIHLANQIIGSDELTPSKFKFKKKIRRIVNCDVVKHFVCHECNLYLGSEEEIKRLKKTNCMNCCTEVQMDTKYKKNHFVTIPFKDHIQNILEQNNDHLNLAARPTTKDICDVHDALYFKHLSSKMVDTPFITLTFSTDGAVLFKSTKEKSLWPLQFFINEIDIERRFKRENLFCSAFAFGKTPNMQVFLRPFIEEINQINENGGVSFALKNGQIQTVKIYPMIFTCDTVARSHVLNKVNFNGYNGCPYCEHRGTIINRQVRYCKRDNGPLRSNHQTRRDMIDAFNSNQRINGYHGVSALMALHEFDVVWQMGIDKMHNIDLGVVKQMFKLFLDPSFRKERYLHNQLIF